MELRSGSKDFLHAVLSFRPNLLDSSKDIAVAVVVQSDEGVCLVGRDPSSPLAVSQIGRRVLERLPEILEEQITEAIESGGSTSIIDVLADLNTWNIVVSPPSYSKSDLPLTQFAFAMFAEHVAGVPETGARRIKKSQTQMRRDKIFEVSAKGAFPSNQLEMQPLGA